VLATGRGRDDDARAEQLRGDAVAEAIADLRTAHEALLAFAIEPGRPAASRLATAVAAFRATARRASLLTQG
jgi:hypothetical protein